MSKIYYKEKLIKLVEKLFTHDGDAKSKFIEFENLILATYLFSKSEEVENRVAIKWDLIWQELNTKPALEIGDKAFSSFYLTVRSKKNKSLIKYLNFFLEEFYRTI